jgi:hypothetical protein
MNRDFLLSSQVGTMNHNMLWLVSPADSHFCQSYRLQCFPNRSHGGFQIVTAGSVAMEREGSCKSLVINGCNGVTGCKRFPPAQGGPQ